MFRLLRALVVASVTVPSLLACSGAQPSAAGPGIVIPVNIAEGRGGGDAPANADPSAAPPVAAAPEPPPPPPPDNAQPDPEPLRTADQVEYTFTYTNGALAIESARLLRLPQPAVTARKMGRFAVELWVGNELVERVRFDFPFLALEDPKPANRRRPLNEPQSLAGGTLRATVTVPNVPRPRRAVLLDRATNTTHSLPWPPAAATTPIPLTPNSPPAP